MFVLSPALLLLAAQTPAPAPATPPVPAPASVVQAPETPDYPAAVWEPAHPGNFRAASRPSPETPIDIIVMHDIEGSAISAVRWFQNPESQVSAHYVVDAVTGTVYQQVKERDIAWHAGNRAINARAVGIEQEGFAYRPGFYTPVLYEASARLVRDISTRHNIPRDRTHIIGHFEVPNAAKPGQFGGAGGHTDPGPYFDWDYFMTLVRNDAHDEEATGRGTTRKLLFLHPGEQQVQTVTLRNTGDDPWQAENNTAEEPERRKAGTVFLGTADGLPSVFFGRDWVSPRYAAPPSLQAVRGAPATGGDIAPGATGVFTVNVSAPAIGSYGTRTQAFRLVKVPVAPGVPVPFGDTWQIIASIMPWDISIAAPVPPPGWTAKPMPGKPAIAFCKTGGTGAPMHYQTTLPVAGRYDVFVRYVPGANRSALAEYRIGNETRFVDQRTGGTLWRKLGQFAFAKPAAPPEGSAPGKTGFAVASGVVPVEATVELAGDSVAPGVVVAGEVRFVGPFAASP